MRNTFLLTNAFSGKPGFEFIDRPYTSTICPESADEIPSLSPDDVDEVLELVSSLTLCFQETYEAKATVIVDEKIEIQATVWCRLLHGTAKIKMNQPAVILCSDAVSREWRPLVFSIGTILVRFGCIY
jgi:hypothetical protein